MPIRSYNNTPSNNGSTPATPTAPNASQVAQQDLPKGLIDMHLQTYKPALFRDKEIFGLMTILNKMNKPNALIIGAAGSGKTAIVTELVHMLETNATILTPTLKNKHIYQLSLSALGAGNSYVGQTEKAINDVIDFATDPANNAIIFIDEVHTLFDERDNQMQKLSQALKPAMARDNFRFIGATTTGESKTVLKDPAMSRRLETVRLHNLTTFETEEIASNAIPDLRKFHNIDIADDLVSDAVRLADQHYVQTARPDNVLSLLDQAFSLKELQWSKLTAPLVNNQQAIASIDPMEHTVSKETLVETINNHTGNSASATPANIETKLKNKVKGQDESITEIAKQITLFRSNLIPSTTPLSLLLAGPTGNGKTETAKAITKALYRDPSRMTTINMTEYSTESTINQLLGSPDGYVGSNSKRPSPFDAVYENPTQILLLDEFEKAHQSIHHLFYQILEEGYIEDRRGRTIDFSHAILIFTTNAQTEAKVGSVGFNLPSADTQIDQRQELINSLKQYIPDALLNRMTAIFKFNKISKDFYKEILQSQFESLVADMLTNDPTLNIDPHSLTDDLLTRWTEESYNPELNGRPARGKVKREVSQATLEALLAGTKDIIIK